MVFLPREKKAPKKRDKPSSAPSAPEEEEESNGVSVSVSTTTNNTTTTSLPFPTRDYANLFCQAKTLQCALANCVPCGYKIGCFDVALDKDFTTYIPNQRPEQCPRLRDPKEAVDGTMGFKSGMKVLMVGDGDFSFSVAVARIVNTTPESQQRVIATSYEAEDTLRKCYPDFDEMVEELKSRGVTIAYQIDATNIESTLLAKIKEKKLPKFDRIIWNFPCTAVGKGQDGQNDAMEENKDLVRNFVRNAKHHLTPTGELHLCHKTKPPFNQWKLEDVVLDACSSSHDNLHLHCLSYHGRVVLDRATLPPYTPRKALDKKSFPCHDACIYIFGMAAADSTSILQPPPVKDASNLSLGVHKRLIVPVDLMALAKVRKTLQTFAKGGTKKRSGNKGANKKQKRFA